MATAVELQRKTTRCVETQVEELAEMSKGVQTDVKHLKEVAKNVQAQVEQTKERLTKLWKDGLEAQRVCFRVFRFDQLISQLLF